MSLVENYPDVVVLMDQHYALFCQLYSPSDYSEHDDRIEKFLVEGKSGEAQEYLRGQIAEVSEEIRLEEEAEQESFENHLVAAAIAESEAEEDEMRFQGYRKRVEREQFYVDRATGKRINPMRPFPRKMKIFGLGWLFISTILVAMSLRTKMDVNVGLEQGELLPMLAVPAFGALLVVIANCLPYRNDAKLEFGEEKVHWDPPRSSSESSSDFSGDDDWTYDNDTDRDLADSDSSESRTDFGP